jgi:hypothetical protein
MGWDRHFVEQSTTYKLDQIYVFVNLILSTKCMFKNTILQLTFDIMLFLQLTFNILSFLQLTFNILSFLQHTFDILSFLQLTFDIMSFLQLKNSTLCRFYNLKIRHYVVSTTYFRHYVVSTT